MQWLILPINKAKLTASWSTAAYYNKYGLHHYGIDLVSTSGKTILYASGNGVVVAAGRDNVVGNVVAVTYHDALHRPTGRPRDVVFRYFHLASISVKAGQRVTKDTPLGYYGNTGQLGMWPHLHLEADTDTTWPLYSPTVWNSNLLQGRVFGATDKTMTNPLEWIHCKYSAPDWQSWATAGDTYCTAADRTIARIT